MTSRPSYARFDTPPEATNRRSRLPLIILIAAILAAALYLGVTALTSTPPPADPPVSGPGPTTQLGVALLPGDLAAWHRPNG